MLTKRIAVLLDDDEYTRLRNLVHPIPLSAWFREVAKKELERAEQLKQAFRGRREEAASDYRDKSREGVPRVEGDLSPRRDSLSEDGVVLDAVAEEAGKGKIKLSPIKRCQHGIERGFHCWRCGGAAKP